MSIFEPAVYKVAMWCQMPGNDYDKPWASWMLNSRFTWLHCFWYRVISEPLVWFYCNVYGHKVVLDGRGWFCACCLGGSRTTRPPAYHRDGGI